jgi:hypothetical protein
VPPAVSADGRIGLQVRAARKQRRRAGTIAVHVRCARACRIAVGGTVRGRTVRGVVRRLAANRWTRVRIRVPRGTARLVVTGAAGKARERVVVRVVVRR